MTASRRLVLSGLIGAAIGLLVILWLVRVGSRFEFGALWIPLALAMLGVGLVSVVAGGRPVLLARLVPVGSSELREHAIRFYATAGWTLTTADTASRSGVLAFVRRIGPDPFTRVVFLLLGVFPGLLYHLFAGRSVTTTIVTRTLPDGTELEIVASARADGGERAVFAFSHSPRGLT